jgi:hypothetical protein
VDHVNVPQPSAAAHVDAILPQILRLLQLDLIVLSASVPLVRGLREMQDRTAVPALANAILRDPLLTLHVLRFLARHRNRVRSAEITTVTHAVLMLGHARFFREFEALQPIEDRFGADCSAAVRAIASRARLAALLARDWAVRRNDLEPEEVMIAALLHELPALLATLAGADDPGSFDASREARAMVFAALEVPGLVRQVDREASAPDMRVWNVRLACRLARDCAEGWQAPAVRADLQEVQRFLHISETQIWERVRGAVLQAAREWHYYQVLPAARDMLLTGPPEAAEHCGEAHVALHAPLSRGSGEEGEE